MLRKISLISGVLGTLLLNSGCPTQPDAHLTCHFTGAEKHVLYFNGAPMGTFEVLSGPSGKDGILTLRRGLFSDGATLKAWLDHNRSHPPIPEEHDLYIAKVHAGGKAGVPEIAYRDAEIQSLDGGEAPGNSDLPGCWAIRKVTFKVRSVEPVTGVITRFQ